MASPLYVAAGGGGDAIMAAVLHFAVRPAERPMILSFSWDRLLVDPLPGPRSASDFDGLHQHGHHNFVVLPTTRPHPPAGSTLPRLAAELDADFALLDPSEGAIGLRRQVTELVESGGFDRIEVVDVGGDILAHGDEASLLSPLADALALAATDNQPVPVTVRVTGAGLDGELEPGTVLARLTAMDASLGQHLTPTDGDCVEHVLAWHPTEATALTIAAACGLRGAVEIRDAGRLVTLTDSSADVYSVDHAAVMSRSRPALAVRQTRSFDDSVDAVRNVCGRSEIDFERSKQARLDEERGAIERIEDAIEVVDAYLSDAQRRGLSFITFRRLGEVAGLSAVGTAELKTRMTAKEPAKQQCNLWRV